MPHLFKYVTSDTGRKIIDTRILRWSTPSMLNDLFDMQFAFQVRLERQAALDAFRQLTNVSREEFNQDREIGDGIDAFLDGIRGCIAQASETILGQFINEKIFCLSDVPDSIVMWS